MSPKSAMVDALRANPREVLVRIANREVVRAAELTDGEAILDRMRAVGWAHARELVRKAALQLLAEDSAATVGKSAAAFQRGAEILRGEA